MESDPHLVLDKTLAGLQLPDLISVSIDIELEEVLHQLQKLKIGALGVVENEKLVGIFSERDFLIRIVGKVEDWRHQKIGDYMTHPPFFLNSESILKEAIALMIRRDFRHIPIHIAGENKWKIISAKDILKVLIEQFPESLNKYGIKTSWNVMELDSFGENFSFDESVSESRLTANLFLHPLRRAIFRNPIIVDEKEDIQDVLQQMQASRQGAAVVTKFRTQVTGIITERDFIFQVFDKMDKGESLPVKNFMTPNPHTLLSRHFICYAINNMFKFNYRNTIIVDEDKLPVACVTLMDLLKVITWNIIMDA